MVVEVEVKVVVVVAVLLWPPMIRLRLLALAGANWASRCSVRSLDSCVWRLIGVSGIRYFTTACSIRIRCCNVQLNGLKTALLVDDDHVLDTCPIGTADLVDEDKDQPGCLDVDPLLVELVLVGLAGVGPERPVPAHWNIVSDRRVLGN